MRAQVHPTSQCDSDTEPPKSSHLRREACLGRPEDGSVFSFDRPPTNRAEFDILLDFLDTDANGKVSALELADFVDSLLSTQDHARPQGSIVFEAVLLSALRFSVGEKDAVDAQPGQRPPPPPAPPPVPLAESSKWRSIDGSNKGDRQEVAGEVPKGPLSQIASSKLLAGGPELHEYADRRFLSMDSVRNCFAELLADTELWIQLAASYSVMTTALFRQLLMYSAGGLEKKFSFSVFVKTYGAFNTLPLWLPFKSLWRPPGAHGILLAVYLHQLAKLHQQLPGWVVRRVDMHTALLVLTFVQFTATYVPLIAFFAAHGIRGMWEAESVVGWMHANPLPQQITFFGSILPFAVLQFLTSSGALKLSCRDFISLKDQCKAVFLLGDVASQFEGYTNLNMRAAMDRIRARVDEAFHCSGYRKLNAAMPLVFGLGLELFRRLVRLFLVRNWIAAEKLAKVVTPFEVYALVYNIWFAYSEAADCSQYLFLLKKTSSTFKALLNKEEALSQALPWLNNHSPRNLLLWSRLRRYYQSPNCLELRWIEMHLTLVVVAAIAVTVILIITIVQGQLLRFTAENADLQLFIIWVIPAFIYLLAGLVVDVIMSASTGAEYHDGIMTLSSEAVAITDRLNCAEELASAGGEASSDVGPAKLLPRSGSGQGPGSLRRRDTSASGGQSSAVMCVEGFGGGGGTAGGWRPPEHFRLVPAERDRLRQCLEVIRSLVSYIQFNAEYITLFGIPIDAHLRNTLFSVAVTLVGAGISAFLAFVVRR